MTADIFTLVLTDFAVQPAGLIVAPEIVALIATNFRTSSLVNREVYINRRLTVDIGCNAAFEVRHFLHHHPFPSIHGLQDQST